MIPVTWEFSERQKNNTTTTYEHYNSIWSHGVHIYSLIIAKTTTKNIKINIMCFNIILSESSEIIVLLVF